MKRVRFRGLVRFANRVRQELAAPISPERLKELERHVRENLETVDGILAAHGARLDAIPAPSRNAYRFLAGLEFDKIQAHESAPTRRRPPSSVSYRGLTSILDYLLYHLARDGSDAERARLHDTIRSRSEELEGHIERDGIRPEELKPQARSIRGWLAFLARRENLDAYCDAVALAQPCFDAVLAPGARLRPPARIRFRPLRSLFRLRGYREGTRVQLATPMICFDRPTFQALANWALGRARDQGRVAQATRGEPYQAILAELELLGGLVDHAAGVYHDLDVVFERVNAEYFGGRMPRPRLNWTRTFTHHTFGHYEGIADTVTVSMTLDSADVAAFVVDFIVYHELLHKKHGIHWRNGRRAAHTPAFQRDERRFRYYAQAEAALAALARSRR